MLIAATFVISLAMHWVPLLALPAGPEHDGTVVPSNITARAPDKHDRGTWVFECANAEEACNNACYYINCRGGKNKFYFDPKQAPDEPKAKEINARNRIWSGCNAKNGDASSACNIEVLNKQFAWPDTYGLTKDWPDCDEFPMAAMRQDTPPNKRTNIQKNSLRCIDNGENRSGGSKLGQFLDLDVKKGKAVEKRIGTHAFADGDYYTIEFFTQGAKTDKMPACKLTSGKKAVCDNEKGFQFYMSKMVGENGKFSKAYNYGTDNHYAVSGKSLEVDAATLYIKDEGSKGWIGEVYYGTGRKMNRIAKATGKDPKSRTPLVLATNNCQIELQAWQAQGKWEFKMGGPISFTWDSKSTFPISKKREPWCEKVTSKEVICQFPILRDPSWSLQNLSV